MKKRLLSSLLALCLLLSLLPVNVLAVEWIAYPAEGGSLYFDPDSGKIMDADEAVTAADIPASIGGVTVTGIGNYVFKDHTALKEIRFPSTLTTIGEGAFQGCTSLREVTLPEGLTDLMHFAFGHCTSLKNISVPGSVGVVRQALFYGCTSLEEISLGEGITRTISNAFGKNNSLRVIHIPHSMEKIDVTSFGSDVIGCPSLTDIYYNGTKGEWQELRSRCNTNYDKCLDNATLHTAGSGATTPGTTVTPGEVPEPEKKDEYTITFDPNGSGVQNLPAQQSVKADGSSKVAKPDDPSHSGYIFAGWYDNRSFRGEPYFDADGNSAAVTKDLTLYAKWKNPVGLSKDDITAFVNSQSDYFGAFEDLLGRHYPMDDKCRDVAVEIYSNSAELFDGVAHADALASAKSFVDEYTQKTKWSGACFGASTIVLRGKSGSFDPGSVQTGAATVNQLKAPKDNHELRSLLHLYSFIQYVPEMDAIIKYLNDIDNTDWNDFVYALQTNDMPVLLGFQWSKHKLNWLGKDTGKVETVGGHAVLAYDCVFVPTKGQEPAHYEVKLWDSRDSAADNIKSPRMLKLYPQKKNSAGVLEPDAEFDREYDDYPSYSTLVTFVTISELTHVTTKDVPERLKDHEKAETSANPGQSGSAYYDLQLPPFLQTNYSDFAIACSDGTSAAVKNGERVSGTLDISGGVDFGLPVDVEGYRPTYTFTLPKADASYAIIPAAAEDAGGETLEYRTVLTCNTLDGYFSSTSAAAPGTITVTGTGATTTFFPSAVEQEVTVVRNGAGTPWFNNTVTASSAGLTADPLSDGSVRFTSSDGARLTLSVSDFDTETVFDPVTPDASGVRIARQGESTAAVLNAKGTVIASKPTAAPGTPDTPGAPEGTLPFTDVKPGQWFYDAVAYVHGKGLMTGVTADTFVPGGTTTRGMIATILHRLEGSPAAGPADFTDVPAGQWYTPAVNWAAETGVVSGYGDGRFAPNAPISREQLVTMLWRYSGSPAASGDLSGFTDADQISAYAREAMGWAVSGGILNGSGGRIDPKGQATRAQVAQLLKNFLEKK